MAYNLEDYKYGVKYTLKHIRNVRHLLNKCIYNLQVRSIHHDNSKFLKDEEDLLFYKRELDELEYMSPAYVELLNKIKPSVQHHYAFNRHHPEFHYYNFTAMNLFDLIEMLCDWIVSTESQDVFVLLDVQQKRFGFSNEIKSILLNTFMELNNAR